MCVKIDCNGRMVIIEADNVIVIRCTKCHENYDYYKMHIGWLCDGCDSVMYDQKEYKIYDVDSYYDKNYGYDYYMLCWSCNKELRK